MSEVVRLPRWKCHKEVSAARIARIITHVDGSADLIVVLDETATGVSKTSIAVTPSWMERFKPEVNGFYVLYNDGYASFSPAKAFLEGYTRIA